MKKAIVYNSLTENTKVLAEKIKEVIAEDVYCGKPSDSVLDCDVFYVGFWTQAFSAPAKIKDFLTKLQGKKIFLFGTAGYDYTPEFFASILSSVKESIDPSNEIIGEFMCQGAVSAQKQEAIKNMDLAKFESMKANIDRGASHPDSDDINNLIKLL